MHQYANIAFKPLKDRLIEYLTSKAHRDVIRKSHQELARELGSTREVISRLLKSLESESKIKLGQKMIVINKK
jgi:CRP/FNR family transcriptional regulator